MNIKLAMTVGLVAGFIGGAMSHVFFPTPVQAQGTAPTEIRAQKFVLVDPTGTPRGVFGFKTDGTPELQVTIRKRTGLAKLFEAEIVTARWMGIGRQKNVLPDLISK